MSKPQTMFDKIWQQHVITGEPGAPQLLYVDLHLVHEVTSPQAFEGLRDQHRKVRRPDKTFATMDHNVPTEDVFNVKDVIAKKQMATLQKNADDFGISLASVGTEDQGIIHVIGPQLGLTQPGKIIVCGDSHTSTHGAFGAIAFGIGTSEVEHVFATQTIWQQKPKTMGIHIHGDLKPGVSAKDIIMALISRSGFDGFTGYAIEFYGDVIDKLSMANRMTLCNMVIEGGAKMGQVQPDQTTFDYIAGRKYAPQDMAKAEAYWAQFYTDDPSAFDKTMDFDVSDLAPYVSFGTNPGMSIPVDGTVPAPKDDNDKKALAYVGLTSGTDPKKIPLGFAFFGSCTNGRLEDLQAAAKILKGHHIAKGLTALVVPGSMAIKAAAERQGLDQIFEAAGCEWRMPGCSACLGMNPDLVPAGVHCASTSNRNFEGRQGAGSITHLASPEMVAAAAIHGHFIDIRKEAI